ncbi:MAG: PEP/pyruvate-binding domain-containing protein, partial [Bdellovibrionota bacterium]
MSAQNSSSSKFTYFFGSCQGGENLTEGKADMKNLLGGKGANLAEMARLGLPVPPGFTISTEACLSYYKSGEKFPAGLEAETLARLKTL